MGEYKHLSKHTVWAGEAGMFLIEDASDGLWPVYGGQTDEGERYAYGDNRTGDERNPD